MGIYDRDYYRKEQPQGISLSGQWSAVGTIVFLNVVVFLLVSFISPGNPGEVFQYAGLHSNLFQQLAEGKLWHVGALLTHGFLHGSMLHIFFNMFLLWMFGRDVETIYGKRLFWRLYLSLIILAGLCWVLSEIFVLQVNFETTAIGASGAVTGVFLLFVLHFPKRTILLWFVIPVPAWLLGVLLIGGNLMNYHGAVASGDNVANIAYSAHLGGALFGYIFYRWHWTLFSFLPSAWFSKFSQERRKTKLRVVRPMEEEDLDVKVDRILAKISRYGADSLTDEEYHTLEAASRRAQRRRGAPMD